jgi:hypothetical protein
MFGLVCIVKTLFFSLSTSFMWCRCLFTIAYNVSRAGDRNPVLRLRQGYGACTLLGAAHLLFSICYESIFLLYLWAYHLFFYQFFGCFSI